MALPPAINTVTVNFGPFINHRGDPFTGSVTFTASRPVVWEATGTPLFPQPMIVTLDVNGSGQIILPATDQAGFTDGAGNAVTDWTYTAAIDLSGRTTDLRNFGLPADGETGLSVDLDLMTPVSSSTGILVSLPDVLSVAGLSGAVGAVALAAALDPYITGGGGGVDEPAVIEIIEENPQPPADASVTDAKVTTGRHLLTTAQQTKLDDLPTADDLDGSLTAAQDAVTGAILSGVSSDFDNLSKIADALGGNPDFAADITVAVESKATDTAVVHNTGAETVAGVKTFSSAPVVPDASFAAAKLTGVIKDTGAQTKAGRLTLSDGVVLPSADLPQTVLSGAELVWVIHYDSATDTWPTEGDAEAPATVDMPAGMRRKMISVGDPAAPMPTALLRGGITHDGHPVLDSWLPHRDSTIWGELA